MTEAAWGPPSLPDLPEEGRLYQHFKGDYYRIVAVARYEPAKPSDEWLVIYRSMKFGHVWARHFTVWKEDVRWPDGAMRPRFVLAQQHADIS